MAHDIHVHVIVVFNLFLIHAPFFSTEPSIPKLNGWLQNNGHMTNHMTSDMAPITESMMEHYKSVSVQQGYDNMVLNSVIGDFFNKK